MIPKRPFDARFFTGAMIPSRTRCVAITSVVLYSSACWACDVPVFRYAMLRWGCEDYRCVVFHRGELSKSQKMTVDELAPNKGDRANLRIFTADVSRPLSSELKSLWESRGTDELPLLALTYPVESKARGLVWSGKLTPETVRSVVSSSAREEIAKRLMRGHCAVWVLVEGGNTELDLNAAACLRAVLREMPDLVKPPEFPGEDPEADDDLKIRFSLLRVARTDPKEEVLLNALLRSEEGLETRYASQPVAFPVFGRGRALYALVGKGINIQNVLDACKFLVGPCGCESDRGIPLPIKAPWDSSIRAMGLDLNDLPEVIGPEQSDTSPRSAGLDSASGSQQVERQAASPGDVLLRNIFIAVAGLIVTVFILLLVVRKRIPRN